MSDASTAPAFLFPGQGSQKVGMGKDWADAFEVAHATFEEADDVLGFALGRMCFEGPEDALTLTANTQPALVTVSIAIARVLDEAGLAPAMLAGHSLGEYAAHVVAGTFGFDEALRLVRRRGELMQAAVPVGVGAMAAILGLDQEAVEAVVSAIRGRPGHGDEVLAVANLNAPGQVVIAGHRAAVEAAAEEARAQGARKAMMLSVSAPFHSPLMRPAREGLTPMLEDTDFRAPDPPVVTNIDAAPVTDAAAARDALVRQIDGPVRWVASIERMRGSGISRFIEVGAGNVLTGLGRRIDRDATWQALRGPDDMEALA